MRHFGKGKFPGGAFSLKRLFPRGRIQPFVVPLRIFYDIDVSIFPNERLNKVKNM